MCWGQRAPTSWCADRQAQCLSSLLLSPHGPCPPQGAERWRKTGKPTKISQVGQTCGADKGRAGWDEVSAAPRWGGPVRAACGHQNASSPALSGLIVSATPKEPTLGVPTVRDLGVSPWPPGHPHGPAYSPAGGSGAPQGTEAPSPWGIGGACPGHPGLGGPSEPARSGAFQMEKPAAPGSASGGRGAAGLPEEAGGGRSGFPHLCPLPPLQAPGHPGFMSFLLGFCSH